MKLKNKYLIVIYVMSILIAVFITKTISNREYSIEHSFSSNINLNEPLREDSFKCEFGISSYFHYEKRRFGKYRPSNDKKDKNIYLDTSKHKELISIAFTQLNTSNPKMIGNLGTADLILLKNNKDSIILATINDFDDMFTYTIFKESKIAVWSKILNLFGTPFTSTSMGYCY